MIPYQFWIVPTAGFLWIAGMIWLLRRAWFAGYEQGAKDGYRRSEEEYLECMVGEKARDTARPHLKDAQDTIRRAGL